MNTSHGKKTEKALRNISKEELKKLIKTELEIVYLTNDDIKFLEETDALKHQFDLETTSINEREKQLDKEKMADLICSIFDNENWGIFFKNTPIQSLPVQDSNTTLYKVNEVNREQLKDKIEKLLSERQFQWQNQTEAQTLSGTETTSKPIEKKSEGMNDSLEQSMKE